MKRIISAAIASAGLVVASVSLAPAAQAITNPADHPHKITVKGDDGNTYVDGQDTLPGYDDEACTYIPGAWFDFDNNRVHYADGQSIPWTEWDRATGYKAWLAKKSQPSPTTPKPKPKPKPKPHNSSAAPDPKNSGGADPQATATTGTTSDGANSSSHSKSTSDAKDGSSDAASDSTDQVKLASGDSDTKASNDSSSGSAGLLILGGLVALGLVGYAGYTVVGRRKGTTS